MQIRQLVKNAVEELLPNSELPAQDERKGGSADRRDRKQLLLARKPCREPQVAPTREAGREHVGRVGHDRSLIHI